MTSTKTPGTSNTRRLFTDGSVNPQSKIGYGAYLVVDDLSLPLEAHKEHVHIKRFTHTSSTQLELETLLWALTETQTAGHHLIVYTDCQNILRLPGRRAHIECDSPHKKHHALYQAFFRLQDEIGFEMVKLKGHQRSSNKHTLEKLFTLVDKASRHALRQALKESQKS